MNPEKKMKIAIVGTGYVGLSNAVLLAQNNRVVALDIDPLKISLLQDGKIPFSDAEIEKYIVSDSLDLTFTTDKKLAYDGADYVVIATPTDYDEDTNYFNTSSVEIVAKEVIAINPQATIVIKSTVPVGFTLSLRNRLGFANIIFSPEFLREGRALLDNLFPSRIVVGDTSEKARVFSELLRGGAVNKDVVVSLTNSSEAEAAKLFANTYLAMRVAYFNELDTYAAIYGLSTRQIIDIVCLDPRIGNYYNNPSFGYGGYCLPKDSKQLLANYDQVPQNIVSAVVQSNITRKNFIAREILALKPEVVGIHRITAKFQSDNFRSSSIQDILSQIKSAGVKILIYEPKLESFDFLECEVVSNIEDFKLRSQLIVANRFSPELQDVSEKVYTRDIFGND